MKECRFCRDFKKQKQINDFLIRGDIDPELGPYMHEYSIALVTHSWYKKHGKRSAGRTLSFRYRGLGYALRFCPECGKEINRK